MNVCVCGCGESIAKGSRFRPGHHSRVRQLYIVDPTTGCWEWQLRRPGGRYGHIERAGVTHMAHKWMWEKRNGPVPEGMELDHLCSNEGCVNPDHLEPVTHLENVRRGRAVRLTRPQVVEILERFQAARLPLKPLAAQLASEYGVSFSCIRDVLIGKTWADVYAEIIGTDTTRRYLTCADCASSFPADVRMHRRRCDQCRIDHRRKRQREWARRKLAAEREKRERRAAFRHSTRHSRRVA